MNKKFEKAFNLMDDILSRKDGEDLFYIANVFFSFYAAELDDRLSREEMISLAERIVEAAGVDTVPILTAERVEAVKTMLDYGIAAHRFPDLITVKPDQAKEILLSCPIDVFIDLTDIVAVNNQYYYSPEWSASSLCDMYEKVNGVISDAVNAKADIETAIDSAEAQKMLGSEQKPVPVPER